MLTHTHERKKRHCQGLGAEASDELICRKSLDFNTWTAWSLKAKLWSALLYIPSGFSILLRFPLLPPGHFSLFYLLTFVGVKWAAGWGTRTGGWSKKGARAEGESSLSWKGKCSRGSAPQETTWHNVRGTIAGQLRVHTCACTQTYLFWGEIMQVGDPWSQIVSPQAKGLCHVGSFLVVFLFPRSRWGFPE